MFAETLQELGLSPNEAKIYEALLGLNQAGVGEISSKAEIHRRNVYDAINRLIDKGLIFPILSKGENIYSPVDPGKLLELVKEKETSLNKILPDLKKLYENKAGTQEAYIYRGVEGFKNYLRDILRVGEDVYMIGAKLGWFDPRLKNFIDSFLKEAKRKKIKFFHIFDAEVKEKGRETLPLLGTDYKFLPPEFSTNSAIDIFGDYVVTFTGLKLYKIDEEVTLFVMKDGKLAESYRIWFKFMYDMCPPKK
ncbi:MAG: helix-turn-helix domain-containing protein [Patescibacteria group bacterium]|nr:helix-turn-helix domain-containing protein [Patescibacteria group bacterium]